MTPPSNGPTDKDISKIAHDIDKIAKSDYQQKIHKKALDIARGLHAELVRCDRRHNRPAAQDDSAQCQLAAAVIKDAKEELFHKFWLNAKKAVGTTQFDTQIDEAVMWLEALAAAGASFYLWRPKAVIRRVKAALGC